MADILLISVIIFLSILIVILLIVGFAYRADLGTCENNQSTYCPQLLCQTPSPTCGNSAFRRDADNNIQCSDFTPFDKTPTCQIQGNCPSPTTFLSAQNPTPTE